MTLPDPTNESSLDDISSIDISVDELKRKFIDPIEAIRSRSNPNVLGSSRSVVNNDSFNSAAQVELDVSGFNSEPQESRTHAFYRMLGLPVIAEDFSFFNPGFNPFSTRDEKKYAESVSSKISSQVKKIHALRENNSKNILNIFKKTGVDASVYTVVLADPNGQKPFNIINSNIDFTQQDNQIFKIPERKVFISKNYLKNDGTNITNYFDSGYHILRPFTVDPIIERTVKEAKNRICQPFLRSKKDTRLEPGVYCKRPAIELILRLRLKQHSTSSAARTLVNDLSLLGLLDVDSIPSENEISQSDVLNILSIIANSRNINQEDVNRILQEVSALEIVTIDNFIKTIKSLINLYINMLDTVSDVSKKIIWTPISSESGPGGGSEIASFIKPRNNTSILQQRLYRLEMKRANAKRQLALSDSVNLSYSDFALSEFQNIEKIYENEIRDVNEEIHQLETAGSDALRIIELITGEVSGLGLIDIISIYTAFWAVDIDVLLSLLDEASFRRLYDNNKELRTEAVVSMNAIGPTYNAFEAMNLLEKQIITILDFADRVYDRQKGLTIDDGTIAGS